MKIIISPAKSFKENKDIPTEDLLFKDKTQYLVHKLKKYTMNEMGNLHGTNDKLTEKAYYDYQEMDLDKLTNPAIFAYDGLVFKQFKREDFDDLNYLNDHLYIISPLYGILKPLTAIADYRLYFGNKDINLYEFWGDLIYKEAYKDNDTIINLASVEYAKTITDYLKDGDRFISLDFKDVREGKLKSIVAWMKQMRGKMLKEIISQKIEDPEKIKAIEIDGYKYDPYNSTSDRWVFVRDKKWNYFT